MKLTAGVMVAVLLMSSVPVIAGQQTRIPEGVVVPQPVPQRPDGWSSVLQLKAGQLVRVTTTDRVIDSATFRAADDQSITVFVEWREEQLPRGRVQQVSAAAGFHRMRKGKLGFLIGGATGASIAAVACLGQDPSCNEGAGVYFYSAAVAGAMVGALLPIRVWRTIYHRAPAP